MLNKKETLYSLSSGVLLGASLTGFYFLYRKIKRRVTPESILQQVQRAFLKEGEIEGSWIEKTKQQRQKFAIKQAIYIGGINRKEDEEMVQYEFIADAKTGSILAIHRVL